MRIAQPLADIAEKDWQRQVVQLANMLGWQHYHTYRSTRSPSGWPDLALVRDRIVLLELKRENGRVSPAQARWLTALTRAHVEVYVARPRHLDALSRVLQARGRLSTWTGAQLDARRLLVIELDRHIDPEAAA